MPHPIKLGVYDFDWTLFRSPLGPPGARGWWSNPQSLCPPVVPMRPGKKWWIEEVVKEMRNDQKRGDAVTSVITGRRGDAVRARVETILRGARLQPSYLRFHDDIAGGRGVLVHKRISLNDILDKHPTITELEVWEDNGDQLETFERVARQRGLMYTPHLVTEIERATRI